MEDGSLTVPDANDRKTLARGQQKQNEKQKEHKKKEVQLEVLVLVNVQMLLLVERECQSFTFCTMVHKTIEFLLLLVMVVAVKSVENLRKTVAIVETSVKFIGNSKAPVLVLDNVLSEAAYASA